MNSNKISVLIIDDNLSFAQMLKENLECTNIYEVIDIINDGIIALKVAFEMRPRVIIADLLIPSLSGKEISSMIEHVPDYKPIYIMGLLNNGFVPQCVINFVESAYNI